jgi:hypothetical protein
MIAAGRLNPIPEVLQKSERLVTVKNVVNLNKNRH